MGDDLRDVAKDIVKSPFGRRNSVTDLGNLERILDESLFARKSKEIVVGIGEGTTRSIDRRRDVTVCFTDDEPGSVGLLSDLIELTAGGTGDPEFDRYVVGAGTRANPELTDIRVAVELVRAATGGETVVQRRVVFVASRSEHEYRIGDGVRTPPRVIGEHRMRPERVVSVIGANQPLTGGNDERLAGELGGQLTSAFHTKRNLHADPRHGALAVCPISRYVCAEGTLGRQG
jgi:hypothetical protein